MLLEILLFGKIPNIVAAVVAEAVVVGEERGGGESQYRWSSEFGGDILSRVDG